MASLFEIQKRLRKVNKASLQTEVRKIITNDQTIIEAKQDEFERGLMPDGGIIGTYSWSEYAQFKQSINPLADGNVDLKLTGSFHSQLFVKGLGNSRFLFNSRDEKAPMLSSKYSSDIFGINKETFNDLQKKEYSVLLIRHIKQITRL